ncbi:hypothetical protein Pan44_54060 [Caulifigura coniformis]|uniref:Uncharacterized protein n=1 Tax=Caulifigura coniformis TaxID=2527983 RepID=A0A517SMJ6_9PLAN|nr:hypothetical protein Pan44_54060 [Caulifigura coniformis]
MTVSSRIPVISGESIVRIPPSLPHGRTRCGATPESGTISNTFTHCGSQPRLNGGGTMNFESANPHRSIPPADSATNRPKESANPPHGTRLRRNGMDNAPHPHSVHLALNAPLPSPGPPGQATCLPRWRKRPGSVSESRCDMRRNHLYSLKVPAPSPFRQTKTLPDAQPLPSGKGVRSLATQTGGSAPREGVKKALQSSSHMSQVQNSNASDGFSLSQVVTGLPPGGRASATTNVHAPWTVHRAGGQHRPAYETRPIAVRMDVGPRAESAIHGDMRIPSLFSLPLGGSDEERIRNNSRSDSWS